MFANITQNKIIVGHRLGMVKGGRQLEGMLKGGRGMKKVEKR